MPSNDRLRVTQVIGNVAVGGAEMHLLGLIDGLRAHHAHVQVICPRPGPLSDQLRARDVAVEFVEMVLPRPGDEYALDWSVVRRLKSVFAEQRPDVVHSHLYPAHLHASLAATEAHVPVIIQTAHTLVIRVGDILLGRLTPTHTIVPAAVCGDALRLAGLAADKLHVIYNGVAPEFAVVNDLARANIRASLGLASGPIIGSVGRLSAEKGHDVLLQAVQRLVRQYPDLTALLIGDGPRAAYLRQVADDLGIRANVRFLGTRNDVAAINHLLDVFVLPSREEACSMALLEAMVAGRPIVATAVGGTGELVRGGCEGLLVAPNDAPALANAISEVLSEPGRAAALGAAARRRVTMHLTRDQSTGNTLALYRRLLHQGTDSPARDAFGGAVVVSGQAALDVESDCAR